MTRSSLRPAFCKEKCNELFTSSTQATFCYKDIKVLRKKKIWTKLFHDGTISLKAIKFIL